MIFRNKLNDEDYSIKSEPIYYATYNGLKGVSFGFVLKGIFKFIKSFKVKTNEKRKRIYSKSAANYNEFLRKSLLEAEKKISIVFKLEMRDLL